MIKEIKDFYSDGSLYRKILYDEILGDNGSTPPEPIKPYFRVYGDRVVVSSAIGGALSTVKCWDGILEYSIDSGFTWNQFIPTVSAEIDSTDIYLRGTSNSHLCFRASGNYDYYLSISGQNIYCDGSIEALLDYQTVEGGGHPTMGPRCFQSLFSTWRQGSAWQYSLINAPALPATELNTNCYQSMFANDKNLISLPKLPATTLPNQCYYQMFSGCTNIKMYVNSSEGLSAYRIPAEGTGTEGDRCLQYMFSANGGDAPATPIINTTYYTSNEIV